MQKHDIPNIISIVRIALVLPVVLLLLAHAYLYALVIFFIAGVSDGVDGFLARQFNWQSRLGSILDPLADKLLLVSCYVTLGWLGHIPWWLVVAVLARDLVIMSGSALYHWLIEAIEINPTYVSKLNTFLQILLIIMTLVNLAGLTLPASLITSAIYATMLTTIVSGLSYVFMWGHRARSKGKKT